MVAWMDNTQQMELTHQDIMVHLDGAMMAATPRGAKGSKATLMTWHYWLGHPPFKMVMELA